MIEKESSLCQSAGANDSWDVNRVAFLLHKQEDRKLKEVQACASNATVYKIFCVG